MTLCRLGDTAKFINGVAFKPADWADEGLPIIRIQNLTGTGESFNRTNRAVRPELIIEPGDLLVSWSATLDAYRWGGPRGVLNQHIFKVLPKDGVNQEYLFYALKQVIAELERKTHGSTMKHVVRGDFEATRIPLPPLPEQHRIVDLLSRAENIVRMRREAETKVKEFIPALFLDMFGDPATNPKGWEVRSVGEVIRSAEYGTSSKASADSEGIPIIRMGNVDSSGRLSLEDLKYVELLEREQRKHSLAAGDILFNRTNSKELVGKTGIWRGPENAVAASYFIRVRVDDTVVTPDFVWAFMNSSHMKRILFSTARGAIGQSNINARELRALKILVPPIGLQRAFADGVARATGLERQQVVATEQANLTLQSLLSAAFKE